MKQQVLTYDLNRLSTSRLRPVEQLYLYVFSAHSFPISCYEEYDTYLPPADSTEALSTLYYYIALLLSFQPSLQAKTICSTLLTPRVKSSQTCSIEQFRGELYT